jgi:hypothetical protein
MNALNFVVWGVPRSGTSPLRHAINLHPSVFCGHEHQAALQAAPARMPDAFLTGEGAICALGTVRDNAAELRAKLDAGPVRLYGDWSAPVEAVRR